MKLRSSKHEEDIVKFKILVKQRCILLVYSTWHVLLQPVVTARTVAEQEDRRKKRNRNVDIDIKQVFW